MKKATQKKTARSAAASVTREAKATPASAVAQAPAPGEELVLEDAVPFLVARAGMRMGGAFSKQLKDFDLNLTEWRVCAALNHKPHQRLSELALQTSAEPSTLSRLVEGLMQRKLLVRDRSGEDARALALSLTPAGVELTRRIVPLAQLYERVALAGISKAQAESLKQMLRQLYDNMNILDAGD